MRGGTTGSPTTYRGAQIRTGDLSDPNGARYQAAPHPEAAHRVPSPGTDRTRFPGYVVFIDNLEGRPMNSVILIGNLASDVELREFGEEKRLATFRLAVDRGGKDAEADFFKIAVWDRQAQLCADYLAKGRKIGVEGRLRYRTWEEEGQKRSSVE